MDLRDRLYEQEHAWLIQDEMGRIRYPLNDEQREELEAVGFKTYAECLKHEPDNFESYARMSIRRAMRKRLDELKPPEPEKPVIRDNYLDEIAAVLPTFLKQCKDVMDERILMMRYAEGACLTGKLVSTRKIAQSLGLEEDEVSFRLQRLIICIRRSINQSRRSRRHLAIKPQNLSTGNVPPPSNDRSWRLWSEAWQHGSERTRSCVKESLFQDLTRPSEN